MRLLLILIASLAVTGVTAAFGHVTWAGDSHTFINYAVDLINNSWNPHLQWRGPTYPVLLILTGVPQTGSVYGILAVQLAMGAAVPLMIYTAVACVDRNAAFIAALICAASFIPLEASLTIYHSQIFMFGLVSAAVLLVLSSDPANARPWMVYALSADIALLGFVRPTVYVIGLFSIALLLMVRRVGMRHVLTSTAIAVAATVSFTLYRSHVVGDFETFAGAQIFVNPYMSGLVDQAELLRLSPSAADFPVGMKQFWHLVATLDNATLARLGLSAIIHHPIDAAIMFASNLKGFTVGAPWQWYDNGWTWSRIGFTPFDPLMNGPPPSERFYINMDRWLSFPPVTEPVRMANELYAMTYRWVAPVSSTLAIFGVLIGAWRHNIGPIAAGGVYILHVAVMAVLVEPQLRYQTETVPLALLCAGFGIAYLMAFVRERRLTPSPAYGSAK